MYLMILRVYNKSKNIMNIVHISYYRIIYSDIPYYFNRYKSIIRKI